MSSLKALQIHRSENIDAQCNRSAQGRIFDQSMISFLKGDDDNSDYQNINPSANNMTDRQDSLSGSSGYQNQEEAKKSNVSFQKSLVNDLIELKVGQDYNESQLVWSKSSIIKNNKVLLINETISNMVKKEEKQVLADRNLEDVEIQIEMGTLIKQQTPVKSNNSNSKMNRICTDITSLQSQEDIDKQNQQIQGKQQGDEEQQNKISENDQNTSEVSKQQEQAAALGGQRSSILNLNKNHLTMERDSLVNFEKAAQIINAVFSKSMNRVQRINKYTQDFINLLRMRMNNRRLPELIEKEYRLINDAAYYPVKGIPSNIFHKFLDYLYHLTKLQNPFPPFMPTDTLRVYWDIVQVIFTYLFIYIYSILIFFANQDHDTPFIQQLFKYTFSIFLIDTLVNFNTAYFDKDCVITNRKQIAWKYISSFNFTTDCINLFVMGWKVIFSSTNLVYNPDNKISQFAFNFLIFLKLNGVSQKRNRFSYVFTLRENQKHIMRLFDQLLTVITVAHVVSLAWYSLGEYELQNGYSVSWLDKYDLTDLSYMEKYIYSLYWSITTMTTVGYGDISASNYVEALFITITMILFSCVFAYSINNIGFILQEIEKASKQLNDNISTMQRYLNRKNVNIALQSRVRHYLSFLAEEQKDRDQQAENTILGLLSNKLRDEIAIEINSRILKNYAIFSANFSSQTLRKLVFIMEEVLISPNEIIFEEGDFDDQSIYFIENGNIEIYQLPISENRTHLLQSLNANHQFGEISFFSGLARKASARSLNLSTLFKINRNDFIELIKENPEDFERFKMMEEQIKFQQDFSSIYLECYSCNQLGHLTKDCPKIHQLFDTQFKVLKDNFSVFQERNYNKRMRKQKCNIFNARFLISKNEQMCIQLKEQIRNFNSYTEIIFMTDQDINSENSEDEEMKTDQDYLTSSDESNSSTEKEVTNQTNQDSLKSLHTPVLKSHSSNQSEKIKSLKKVKTKKSMKVVNRKRDESLKDVKGGAMDIDHLESLINLNEKTVTLKSKAVIYTPTSNILEDAELNRNQSHSLFEKSELSKRESFEKGQEDMKEMMPQHLSHELIENITSQSKSPYSKPVNNSNLTINSSIKELSNQNIQDNNNNIEEHKSNLSLQQKRKYTWQVNNSNTSSKQFENQEDNSSQNSNEERILRALSNNLNKAPNPQNTDRRCRPSIESFLTGALQSAFLAQNMVQISSQSDINRIEKTLVQLEDKIQSFSTIINQNQMKNGDSVLNKSNKKITLKSPSSSIFKKLSGYDHQFRLSQISQNEKHLKQKSLANNINDSNNNNNSNNFLSQPQVPSEHAHSQQMMERISKFFQQSIIGGLLKSQNGTINEEAQSNLLSMNNFDKLKNFKKFFPHNNFSQIFRDFKYKKQIASKKQKLKTQVQLPVRQQIRRNNILLQNLSPRKSQFCNAIIQKQFFPSEINFDSYKPTFLSYGVSQKSESIYPKNLIKQDISYQTEEQ